MRFTVETDDKVLGLKLYKKRAWQRTNLSLPDDVERMRESSDGLLLIFS